MNFFDKANYVIRNSEASLVNFLSAIAPWFAPLAPAYMTYEHLSGSAFGFPVWVAFAVALVVEILGLSAVSTTLAFWTHNRRRLAEHKKAPVQLAVLSFTMYLVVIITINVILDGAQLLDTQNGYAIAVIIAKLLVTSLSIPAAFIMGSRTIHTDTLSAIATEKEEKRQAKYAVSTQPAIIRKQGRTSEGKEHFIASVMDNKDTVDLSDSQAIVAYIVQNYNTKERTAWRWLKEARQLLEREIV